MWREGVRLGPIVVLCLPALTAVSVLLLHVLPNEVLTFLTVWILASLPIGVLIGHCVLSEASTSGPSA